jgi:hypothetical protein
MSIFQDEQYRVTLSVFQEDGDKSCQGLLALTLWGQIEQRIAIFRQSERQERRQQRYRVLDRQSVLAQRGGKCLQLRVRSIRSMEL